MHDSIFFGYEKYQNKQDWTLNGRVEPSTILCTNEHRQKLDNYSLDIYDALISAEHKENTIIDIFNNIRYDGIIKKSVYDLQNQPYLYVIQICNFHVYNTFTSHISISNKVESDVRKKQAKIVFWYHNEGHSALYTDLLENFRKLIMQLNLPKEQLYFVHSDANHTNYTHQPYTYVYANNFPFWLYKFRTNLLTPYTGKKLFLYYSRNLHTHRLAFTMLLEKENLLSDSIHSFGSFNNYNFKKAIRDYSLDDQTNRINYYRSLENTSLDYKDIITYNPAAIINKMHYEETFVSVVSETIIENNICFFSEKIYKPICIGHPFILIGSPLQLQQLKKQNYRTFDKFWDESYDTEIDNNKRLRKIINILKELKKLSVSELQKMRADMIDILTHNQKIFNKVTTPIIGIYHQTGIYKIFKDINDR